ncbi:MAG: 2-oxo acid dehydrogenase subunit E2 [Proteobacteria bacterium]|nr:2-oxo acid dehydrogenase subunit E2 [Pseudomonadota bacterium]MCP4921845.1 2-oxo acid dehydrogenase subunit E2 [Pseudomonadota bacterium]
MGKMSVRRKLAIASWAAPQEGNIYGKLTVDATQAVAYIEHCRATTGEKVTITHLVGRAVGEALAQAPTLNGRIVWGGFEPHDQVDLSFLVVLDGGKNLAKAKIENIDQKTCGDIAAEVRELAAKLRDGKDETFKKSQGPLAMLPTWIIRPLVKFTGWLTGAVGLEVKGLGLESFPFGTCIITSVGMFGLDEAFVPPTPWAQVPIYVLIGAIKDRPAVVDGQLVIQKQLTLTATIDHRFIDGFQGGVLAKVMRDVMENPWQLDGLDGPPA